MIQFPKLVHFVWVSANHSFGFIHYLAVRNAIKYYRPKLVFIYNDVEPIDNVYWDKIKSFKEVIIEQTIPPETLNGHPIQHPQHKADYIRICKLFGRGGLYLDLDMVLVKDPSPVLEVKESMIMCRERPTIHGCDNIINCIIFAMPRNEFLQEWIKRYDTEWGTDKYAQWFGFSTQLPNIIYEENKDKDWLYITPCETFMPFLWERKTEFGEIEEGESDIPLILKEPDTGVTFDQSYSFHFWESVFMIRHPHLFPSTAEVANSRGNAFRRIFSDAIIEFVGEDEFNTTSKKFETNIDEIATNKIIETMESIVLEKQTKILIETSLSFFKVDMDAAYIFRMLESTGPAGMRTLVYFRWNRRELQPHTFRLLCLRWNLNRPNIPYKQLDIDRPTAISLDELSLSALSTGMNSEAIRCIRKVLDYSSIENPKRECPDERLSNNLTVAIRTTLPLPPDFSTLVVGENNDTTILWKTVCKTLLQSQIDSLFVLHSEEDFISKQFQKMWIEINVKYPYWDILVSLKPISSEKKYHLVSHNLKLDLFYSSDFVVNRHTILRYKYNDIPLVDFVDDCRCYMLVEIQ